MNWNKEKQDEWKQNAQYWIQVIQEGLDPFRVHVTDPAILQALPKRKKVRVLDAGCGEGNLCRKIALQGASVWGIDFSPELIEAAQAKEEQFPLGINYQVADMRKLPFPRNSFDAVVSHQSIHELKNPDKALQEFERVLKPGGHAFILFLHPCFDYSIPNLDLYFTEQRIQRPHYLVGGRKSPAPYFYLHRSLQTWAQSIARAGLTIQEVTEPRPVPSLINDPWWKEHFNRPRFLFITAKKDLGKSVS
jgi:ubiquinone/menaquinone biosynthesis C-methylase UbiE